MTHSGSKKISLRIPAADHLALCQFASQQGRKARSQVIRKIIHEGLGLGPYLIGNDLDSFRAAAREVWSVGINLNQLVRAINADKLSLLPTQETQIILATLNAVEALKKEQTAIILRSRNQEPKNG